MRGRERSGRLLTPRRRGRRPTCSSSPPPMSPPGLWSGFTTAVVPHIEASKRLISCSRGMGDTPFFLHCFDQYLLQAQSRGKGRGTRTPGTVTTTTRRSVQTYVLRVPDHSPMSSYLIVYYVGRLYSGTRLPARFLPPRLERCEWMSRSHLAATAAAGASVSASDPPARVPCRFPQDGGRSELARRPACRLVLSIHDELLYEVRGLVGTTWQGTARANYM